MAFHVAEYAERKSLPLAGMMVENTFLSISHMVDQLMPFLTPLKPLVLKIGWNNYKIAPKLKTPILYLAGDSDELVPHNQMLELFELSKKSSTFDEDGQGSVAVWSSRRHGRTWS